MKTIIITIVLGVIVATIVGVVYFSNVDTNIQGVEQAIVTSENTALAPSNPDQIKGKDSIMSLLNLGKTLECTFSFSSDNMKGEGTGYFDKGRSRVDSLYTGTGEATIASYMITDSTTNLMYTWYLTEGKMMGMKMAMPTSTKTTTKEPASVPDMYKDKPQVNTDTAVTYDCKPWNVDNSVFVPPADVEFTDMSEMQKMMKGMSQGMGDMRMPGM